MNEFITLIHAQWRSLSKLFYCVIGMEVALTLLIYLGEGSGSDGSALIILFSARTIWVALLLLTPGDDDRLSLNMPEYLRYLPVDAWKIGAARMFFGVVTCFVLSLADSTLFYALFDARFEQQLPIGVALWATPLAYVVLQPIIWWLGPAGFISTAAVLVGVPSLWNIGLRVTEVVPKIEHEWNALVTSIALSLPGTSNVWLWSTVFLGCMYLIGVAGIAQHRKGRFSNLKVPSLRRNSTVSLESVRTEKFSSPEEALRWLEYREHWKLFPWLLTFLFVGSFLFVSLVIWPDGPTVGKTLVAAIITLIFGMAGVAAFFVFRAWRQSQNRSGSFLFYQPATTLELSTARWKANARALALGIAPLIGIAVLCIFFTVLKVDGVEKTMFGHLTNHQPAFLVLLVFAATAVSFWLSGWAVSSGESYGAVLLGSILIASPIEAINAMQRLSPAAQEKYAFLIGAGNVVAYGAIVGVVAGFIWITVRAVGYLRRNNLFDAKPLLMLALISPCMAVGYVAMLNLGQFSFQNLLNHDMLLILSMFVPLIFLPILTTPGAMHWCRHRK